MAAVVADEVRALAARTTKATQEIGDMIRHIQQDTQGAVSSMEEGTQKVACGVVLVNKTSDVLAAIIERVTQTTDMIGQIAVAAEELSLTTRSIASDVENVSTVSKESAYSAAESSTASHGLNRLATELQTILGEFKISSAPQAQGHAGRRS